jgi:hypothetical protein
MTGHSTTPRPAHRKPSPAERSRPDDVSRNVPCSFSLYTWEKNQMYGQRNRRCQHSARLITHTSIDFIFGAGRGGRTPKVLSTGGF